MSTHENNENKLSKLFVTSIILWTLLFGAFCGLLGARIQQNMDYADQNGANVQQSSDHQDTTENNAGSMKQNPNQDNTNDNQTQNK